MSQHDYSISDQDGASFLVDLNNALVALASANKGGTAPATPYDGQVWCDDGGTPWVYKVYSGADQGWRPFLKLDAASGTVTLVGGVELSSALSIAQGGTGATTAESARTALGFTAPILDRTAPGDIGRVAPGAVYGTTVYANAGLVQKPTSAGTFQGLTIYNDPLERWKAFLWLDDAAGELRLGNNVSWPMTFYTNNVEAARIDSNGNLLVNTTDIDAGINGSTAVGAFSLRAGQGLRVSVGAYTTNYFNKTGGDGEISVFCRDGANLGAIASYSSQFTFEDLSGNGFAWRDSAGNTDMTLDSSGNLLMGKTDTQPWNNNAGSSADNGFVASTNGFISVAGYNTNVLLGNRTGTDGPIISAYHSGVHIGALASATIGGTQRFVVQDLNGNDLYLQGKNADTIAYRPSSGTTTTVLRIKSDYASTHSTHMVVYANGDVQNTNNSYGALSDRKIKQDVTLASSQWDDVKAIGALTSNYRLIAEVDAYGDDANRHIGWIAQEVREISPGLVKETPDMETVEETYTETETRQVIETVQEERTITTYEPDANGNYVQVVTTEMVDVEKPVYDTFPVVDSSGQPIMRRVKETVLDEDGNELEPAVYEQATHSVPRMETVEVTKTRTVGQPILNADGTPSVTLSLKHSILYAKAVKALSEAQERIEALEAENATLKAQMADVLARLEAGGL